MLMSQEATGKSFYVPSYKTVGLDNMDLLVSPDPPNWMAVDRRGREIMDAVAGGATLEETIEQYATQFNQDYFKAWLHCSDFLRKAMRQSFVSPSSFQRERYLGRGKVLKLEGLEELWLHVTNRCNLACTHCLVESSPEGEGGLGLEEWKETVNAAIDLGVKTFYITGGEPFIREDIISLLEYILARPEVKKLVVLTNGTLLGEAIPGLASLDRERLQLQVSLDGPSPGVNDSLRGEGSFSLAIKGIEATVKSGFDVGIATTVMRENLDHLPGITRLVSRLEAGYHHLLFLHPRGKSRGALSPPASKMRETLSRVLEVAEEEGVELDNLEQTRVEVDSPPGVKRDLCGSGFTSLCINFDGGVYPSPSLAGVEEMKMGDLVEGSLEEIWRGSRVARGVRDLSVKDMEGCKKCLLRFICGGGDLEQAYFSSGGSGESHCEVRKHLLFRAMGALAEERKSKSHSPALYRGMGEGALPMDSQEVMLGRSNCALSASLEAMREKVRKFYSRAAREPVEELCCSGGYSERETAHLPEEVLEVAYGCGSPIGYGEPQEGETVVDLGSGGGIDCFVAAEKVGREGRVVGIDMTEEMLERARRSKAQVAESLGYDVVEFREGYLEELPLPEEGADLVVSNCVINLSPHKRKVLGEIWRVLREKGRVVISDTLSEEEVPHHMRSNPRLWGECISGALTEQEYLDYMEEVGFYGATVLEKSFWKEVEGRRFYSAVIKGYKFKKGRACIYRGHRAIYRGKHKAVMDEEGHIFPRGVPVEVCTGTASRLSSPPYSRSFTVLEPEGEGDEYCCCGPDGNGPC